MRAAGCRGPRPPLPRHRPDLLGARGDTHTEMQHSKGAFSGVPRTEEAVLEWALLVGWQILLVDRAGDGRNNTALPC